MLDQTTILFKHPTKRPEKRKRQQSPTLEPQTETTIKSRTGTNMKNVKKKNVEKKKKISWPPTSTTPTKLSGIGGKACPSLPLHTLRLHLHLHHLKASLQ